MEQRIRIDNPEQAANLFGSFDANLRLLEKEFSVSLSNRDGELRIEGEEAAAAQAAEAVRALLDLSASGETIEERNVRYVASLARTGQAGRAAELSGDVLCVSAKGRPVRPKTIGQREYIKSVLENTVTIGVGPAGTGKTYLAVAAAVRAFRDRQVSRIILTRPAVEAGERLGFLPGDLQSKVDPYLRPLYDALFDMLGAETYQKYMERGSIEIAPLAYMRGRTLDDSFIILDEAQNTSREQMKMFLTRLGFGSKIVITGDATQIDLPDGKPSGLREAMRVLRDVEGVGICELTDADVVRHVMVQRIVRAYEVYEQARRERFGDRVDDGRGAGRKRAENADRPEKPKNADRTEKPEKPDRPDKGEKPIKLEKQEKPGKDRIKRDRPVKSDKPKKAKKMKPVKRGRKAWMKGRR